MAEVENGIVLLHCEDLTDSLGNSTITNNGVTVSTDQYKFGASSLYFNRSSSTYLTIGIESQDTYTIEFWFYAIGANTSGWYPTLISSNTTNANGGTYIHIDDGGYGTYPVYRANNTSSGNNGTYGSTVITREEWHHMAICKSGSSHYCFLDGSLEATVTQSSPDTITTWYIGGLRKASAMDGSCYFTGYIDELLISSTCKWTSAFTPPTEAYSTSVTTYTVRFLDWDDNIISTQSIAEGGNATLPDNPTRTGYTFNGWQGTYTNITADIDIKATYTINSYTVKFLDWDNSVIDTQSIEYNNDATLPDNPTRTGYTFIKWIGNYTNIAEDKDIIAQYSSNAINIGNNKLSNMYIGDNKILYAYIGNNLIYENYYYSYTRDGLVAFLCKFDATNNKMLDIKGDYDLTITGSNTTINDNNLIVASSSTAQGTITLPMDTLTQFTFSYVVDGNWKSSSPTQIISGAHSTTFYMWLMTTNMNLWYSGTKIIGDNEYVTASTDNAKFIDIAIDVTNGTCDFYVNGELKISKTGLSLTQASSNELILNNVSGYTSVGDFTLYSFKVYNKCLNINEIQKNIDYEKTRLNWE